MSYDFSQLEKVMKQLPSFDSIDFANTLSPEICDLLNSLGKIEKSGLVSAAQAYSKALDLHFPELSATLNEIFVTQATQLSRTSPSAAIAGKELAQTLTSSLSYNINVEGLRAAMVEGISSIVKTTRKSNIPSDDTDEDYITTDEAPIKEWNIPDTIAIPIPNHRIRMRTDIFISILGGIVVPIFLWIAGQIVDLHKAYINAKVETKRIELEQERNNLIRENNRLLGQCLDLLNSIDTSNSSEAEQIESWKEGLPEAASVPSASDSAPGLTQETQNNSPE